MAYNESELSLIKGDLVIYLDAERTPSRPNLHDLLQMYETDGYYLSAWGILKNKTSQSIKNKVIIWNNLKYFQEREKKSIEYVNWIVWFFGF